LAVGGVFTACGPGAVMSETPSSAVTTAPSIARPSFDGRLEAAAGLSMAVPSGTDGTSAEAALDHAAALALDDAAPLDLLLRPRGLVDITLPVDAPLYAADGIEDWSSTVHDAARLLQLRTPGLDLVFDGAGSGDHLAGDHPAFAAAEASVPAEGLVDPLVGLGPIGGDVVAFVPSTLDAPVHVDVAVDEQARVDLEAPDLRVPELSWLAAINGGGLHVGEAWAWDDTQGAYVFDHYV
jgi:hypothetical protein